MNGLGTIDNSAILTATYGATRDQALKLRELWRMQLRWLEDLHGLPHSFQTKAELTQREIDEQSRNR